MQASLVELGVGTAPAERLVVQVEGMAARDALAGKAGATAGVVGKADQVVRGVVCARGGVCDIAAQ